MTVQWPFRKISTIAEEAYRVCEGGDRLGVLPHENHVAPAVYAWSSEA